MTHCTALWWAGRMGEVLPLAEESQRLAERHLAEDDDLAIGWRYVLAEL